MPISSVVYIELHALQLYTLSFFAWAGNSSKHTDGDIILCKNSALDVWKEQSSKSQIGVNKASLHTHIENLIFIYF